MISQYITHLFKILQYIETDLKKIQMLELREKSFKVVII